MEWLTLMLLSLSVGSISGVVFVVHKILQEEREKRRKAAFVKAFSERYNKRAN